MMRKEIEFEALFDNGNDFYHMNLDKRVDITKELNVDEIDELTDDFLRLHRRKKSTGATLLGIWSNDDDFNFFVEY